MGDRVKGKVAIVTGAGSIAAGVGNGKAAAILYAREGARVMVVDSRIEAARETERTIREEGGECAVFEADVSRADDCRRMVEKCIEIFGRIDILHNNVGIVVHGGAVETSEEDWDRVMAVNLKSMFLTCKYVLPHMERQSSGAIVNISADAAIRQMAYPAISYAASKAGVNALTREVALRYAAKGIRANAVMPGTMKTPMVMATLGDAYDGDADEVMRQRDASCPTGHQGDAWDTAYAALFLASDEARYITATTLVVDGGLTVKG